jgi:outer membrane protein assembly factor BamD (BamD/ComL family)
MLDNGLYDPAIMAFRQVRGATEDRAHLERALFGLGSAHYEMKNYDESIKPLEELMERYPQSGLFYDAKFILGNNYRATGRPKEATDVMRDIFKYAEKADLVARANYTLGLIQIEGKELDAALASFQRVALLSDAKDPALRPIVEQCILECIKVAQELGRWKDASDSVEQFLEEFPASPDVEKVRALRADLRLKASSAAPAPAAPAK